MESEPQPGASPARLDPSPTGRRPTTLCRTRVSITYASDMSLLDSVLAPPYSCSLVNVILDGAQGLTVDVRGKVADATTSFAAIRDWGR